MRAALIGLLTISPVAAEVTPSPTGGDPHIQSVAYDPQEVVALHVAGGFAVTIVFSPDERIETVTVGDSAGWQVQVNRRADELVVKPVGFPPSTNLTVMSDQRAYIFTLTADSAGSGAQPYLLRFTYPAPAGIPALPVEQVAAPAVYRLQGSRSLRPTSISDDGTDTSIIWPANTPLPAIYMEDIPGHMALTNGGMREGAFVVEGVHRKLIFILGSARATATRTTER